MGIKSILLSLTTLVLGVLLFTNAVSAQSGYCSNTTAKYKGSGLYTYKINQPSIGSSTNCLMNTGTTGAGVSSLQSALNHCYGRSLVVDGIYGTNTTNAVKYAQGVEGMTQDGIYVPMTASKFYWWSASTNGGPTKCLKL